MATDLEKLVVQLSADIRGWENGFKKAKAATDRQMRAIERRNADARKKIDAIWSGAGASITRGLGALGLGFGTAQSVRAVTAASAEYVSLKNALRVTGLEGEKLESTLGNLFQIAQKNGTALGPLTTLYSRAAQAQGELKASSAELLEFTDGISLALRVAGTDSQQASGALLQLFTFAKAEGAVFDREPKWEDLLLPEPVERVRELKAEESDALDAAMRTDYGPFFEFVRASGMRLKECVTLRWSEVDFDARQIVRTGKGGRRVVFPVTAAVRDILYPLRGRHEEFVFTYTARQTSKRKGRVRGQTYPLTYNGAKAAWQAIRAASGIADFRFHDFRHDFGTKLLRESGNLKLVQKALNHRDIKSTLRYAHVLDEDVAEAVERLAESRKKSRTGIRDAS